MMSHVMLVNDLERLCRRPLLKTEIRVVVVVVIPTVCTPTVCIIQFDKFFDL